MASPFFLWEKNMQNRLTPGFIQGLRQQQRINQMNQMQARRNNPRQRTLRPEIYQRQQLMQRGQPRSGPEGFERQPMRNLDDLPTTSPTGGNLGQSGIMQNQRRKPLFNQGRINPDFSINVTNPDLRGPNRTQNQSIDPKFRRPTQGGK